MRENDADAMALAEGGGGEVYAGLGKVARRVAFGRLLVVVRVVVREGLVVLRQLLGELQTSMPTVSTSTSLRSHWYPDPAHLGLILPQLGRLDIERARIVGLAQEALERNQHR